MRPLPHHTTDECAASGAAACSPLEPGGCLALATNGSVTVCGTCPAGKLAYNGTCGAEVVVQGQQARL